MFMCLLALRCAGSASTVISQDHRLHVEQLGHESPGKVSCQHKLAGRHAQAGTPAVWSNNYVVSACTDLQCM